MSQKQKVLPKVIAIIGPTGSGKTAYALKNLDPNLYELINVDTLQFYKHLKIGNNKGEILKGKLKYDWQNAEKQYSLRSWFYPEKKELICWGFNFLDETAAISSAEFQQLVYGLIKEIWARGKTPALVGGSGMYLAAILKKYQFAQHTTSSDKLSLLKEKLANASISELMTYLINHQIEFKHLNQSDRNNPRRLVNLILRIETIIDKQSKDFHPQNEIQFDTEIIALEHNAEELEKKLRERIEKMLDQGLISEVAMLLQAHSIDKIASQIKTASGYNEIFEYFTNQLAKNQNIRSSQIHLVEEILISHKQLVKKQQRWNKKYLNDNYH